MRTLIFPRFDDNSKIFKYILPTVISDSFLGRIESYAESRVWCFLTEEGTTASIVLPTRASRDVKVIYKEHLFPETG